MTSAPIAKRPDTGGMSAPIAEGHLKGWRSSVNPTKKGTNLSRPSKTLLAWPEQNQTREDWASWSLAPGSTWSRWKQGANQWLLWSWTLHGNHTWGSPHRPNSNYCRDHMGHGTLLILQGLFVSARGWIWWFMNFFTYQDAPFPCWVETYWQSWGHKSSLPLESLWASPWGANRLWWWSWPCPGKMNGVSIPQEGNK